MKQKSNILSFPIQLVIQLYAGGVCVFCASAFYFGRIHTPCETWVEENSAQWCKSQDEDSAVFPTWAARPLTLDLSWGNIHFPLELWNLTKWHKDPKINLILFVIVFSRTVAVRVEHRSVNGHLLTQLFLGYQLGFTDSHSASHGSWFISPLTHWLFC